MMTGAQRTELNERILSILDGLDQGSKAFDLAERLDVAPRDVVGRLQSLKRQGLVTHEQLGQYSSSAGQWFISDAGRESIGAVPEVPI